MKINRLTAAFVMAPLALAISACDKEEKAAPAGDDASRAAEGEVLGGSISDEMIDYEAIQSRAPTLKEDPDGDGSSQSGGDADDGDEKEKEG